MHIPDGFLSIPVALVCWIIAIAVVSYSLRDSRKTVDKSKIPLIAALGAFVFAAQMLNFPVLGGTSGHLIGGALLAILLGFSPAVVAMASVLFIQAFIFHDGGIFALGANLLNMAILAPLAGVTVKKFVSNDYLAVSAASLLSVVAAASLASLELYASGVVAFTEIILAMVPVHILIGLGEAAISLAVFAYAANKIPSFSFTTKRMVMVSVVLALFLSPFACASPDGLEKTAEDMHFDSLAMDSMTPITLMANYLFPFVENEAVATALAGFCGTAFVFTALFLVFRR